MNRYDLRRVESDRKGLLEFMIDGEYSWNKSILDKEITWFLESNGSDVVENKDVEPTCIFSVETSEGNIYGVGITSVEVEEDCYEQYYWIRAEKEDLEIQ